MSSTAPHAWSFFRRGAFDQASLKSAADLAALGSLDQKLWVALACPSTGLEFDARTLGYIDTDGDGRIRPPEILTAVNWALACLKDKEQLMKGSAELPISAIDEGTKDGAAILASIKQVLASLGKGDAQTVSVADTSQAEEKFAQERFNGDGVIPADVAADEALQAAIADILGTCEPAVDRSGKPGVDRSLLEAFFTQATAYRSWAALADEDGVLPLGPATAAAHGALLAVSSKIEDFFARCRLAAFDGRAIEALNREESEYLALAAKDLSITSEEVAGLPLARVGPDASLPLGKGVNPAWVARVAAFDTTVVRPLLGEKARLGEAEWKDLRGRFAQFEAWQGAKAGAQVEALGLERINAILDGEVRAGIEALIARDDALAPEAAAIVSADRLVRFNRDLVALLHNFVNFRDFYSPERDAVFQAGTLYLDQRSCKLCIRVSDMAKHGTMAPLSATYVAYCNCVRKTTGQTMTIAAAFTDGDSDNLMVGRNGVFYDRDGNDWDAAIVKIVESPMSIRQAFWSPYKRLIRFVEDQVAKRAAAADKDADSKLATSAQGAADAAKTGAAPAERPRFDVGVIAAMGVAIGGMVAALGIIMQAFFGLGIWMPVGLLGLVFLISGPSMLIAWLKLRRRNIGPLLDANGWAVNANARINVPFGRSLTGVAKLPKGSKRDLADPYAESNTRRNLWIGFIVIVLIGVLWVYGLFDPMLPNAAKRATLQGPIGTEAAQVDAPAATEEAPAASTE